MNWQTLVAAAEVVASVTVIISLIYLAIQVRLQAAEYRMMVISSLTQQWAEAVQTLAVHEDLHKIWMRGLQDIHGLSALERGRFSAILINLTQIFESLHLHFRQGKVDPVVWNAFDTRLRDVFATPGVRHWWSSRRHWHNRHFRGYVDDVISKSGEHKGGYEAIYGEPFPPGPQDQPRPRAA